MDKIKILIINPNSNPSATEGIQINADAYAGDEFEVKAIGNAGGPECIDVEADRVAAAPGMEKILRENEDKYDAFVVSCHCDPNVPLLRSITDKPVVGIGMASMHMAAMLGEKWSIISCGEATIPEKKEQVKRYGLDGNCVSYRPAPPIEGGSDEENTMQQRFLRGAKVAVEQDGAKVIVPAICGFPKLDSIVEAGTGAKVMDGVACAMYMARDLVAYARAKKG